MQSQTQHFIRAKLSAAAIVAAAMLAAPAAFASGSMSPDIGSGNDAYATGKSILYKQVVCSSCPYAGRAKNATDAKSLRDALNAADSKVKLSGDDKAAVNTFLSERFKLAMADKK